MSGHERQQILTRVSELIEQYADDLALCETLDMGKAIHFAKMIDARLMADLFRLCGHGSRNRWRDSFSFAAGAHPKHVTIVREPLGLSPHHPFNFH